jgi:GDP-mannose 6-dehydrogenase
MKVAVLGLGYVGAVSATCLADRGHEVIGVDVDPDKVQALNAGQCPVVEPGLDPLTAKAVATGALRATGDLAEALREATVSLVCVGTPSAANGATDVSYVRRVIADIGTVLRDRPGPHVVVIRSTVPPGTVAGVLAPALEETCRGRLGRDVHLAMCPEFLREGCGVADFFDPPFVVLGGEPAATGPLRELFGFVDAPVHEVPVSVAESLKLSCNAFHALKVTFANELARLYRCVGVDSREVMELFVQDTVLNVSPAYLRPGFAFGGSCLPKDVRSLLHLSRVHSVDLPVLAGVLPSNEVVVRDLADRVVRRVDEVGGADRRVALLGLAFKAATDDLRESPNVELAERLIGKGIDLRINDPVVNPARLRGANLRTVNERLPHLGRVLCETPEQALDGAPVVVVSTAAAAVTAAVVTARPAAVFDLTGRLGAAVEALPGYEGIGW